MNNLKNLKQGFLYVLNLDIKNKKSKFFVSIIFANSIVVLDILIIFLISYLITGGPLPQQLLFLEKINNFEYFLPFLGVIRFLFIYLDQINRENLRINLNNRIKNNIVETLFNEKNVSLSDASFILNVKSEKLGVLIRDSIGFLVYFVQLIFFSIYLFYLNFSFTLYLFLLIPVLYIPISIIQKKTAINSDKYKKSLEVLNFKVEQIINNYFLIKIFQKDNEELNRFDKETQNYKTSYLKLLKGDIAIYQLPNFVAITIFTVLLLLLSENEFLTLEYLGLSLRLFQILGSVSLNLNQIIKGVPFIDKADTDLDNQIDIVENLRLNKNLDSEIAFQLNNVNFKFRNSNKNLFTNLNLKILKNQHTIITGPNGSGKSTLIGILSGIYTPNSGLVETYSSSFGYVGTKPFIFTGTLRENIMYGVQTNIPDSELDRYLSEFEVFSESNYENLSLKISQDSLSSGQIQKINFIRLMIQKPDIVFLDEATSNLDLESKKIVFDKLQSLSSTIINVTHNIDDFKFSDSEINLGQILK